MSLASSGAVPDILRDPSGIPDSFASALYQQVRQHRPGVVVEVGMAHGHSSVAILSALREIGEGGRLISIDPYQHAQWSGAGLANLDHLGLTASHQLIEEPDYLALPDLVRSGLVADFAYLDGWHTFDHTLLDFWYVDRLLRVGGIVGFNDCGWRAVHKVLGFVRTHRHYHELDLTIGFHGFPRAWRWVRRLTGWTMTDRYFQKADDWKPNWDFFARF